ncbi:uncharacterized protein LOC110990077 isoform X2 [Acanthaster planci]|nr:uncharacterized protein LOC110990077 isoform X2 [Acanthaster planci]XP_022110569.1 uncharacterized protein LOC110990077 isoform X2 [Acanthaster planci]XP_022110570.1 uncharacterized protein LOC110990077 isoform X2 [Acanthaster planci]
MISRSKFLTQKSTPARNEKFGRWILAGVLLNLCLGISVSGHVVLREDRREKDRESEVAVAHGIQHDGVLSSTSRTVGEVTKKQEGEGLQSYSLGGDTYVRWGRTTCPDISSTELVYTGYTAGEWYSFGGTSDFVCLPQKPQWGDSYKDGFQSFSHLYGTEYRVGTFDPFSHVNTEFLNNHAVPCAVCRLVHKTKLLYPAKLSCPSGWMKEYSGFLMAGYYAHGRTKALCVDEAPEVVFGSSTAKYGALLYVMESACGSLPCPPYVNGREITCTVCSI